jgi:hypothetical protein
MKGSPNPRLALLVASLVTAMGSTLVPSVAQADPASDAKDLFARGRELRAGGDCPGAVTLFRKAYDLYPEGLGSLRNLAECDESLGLYASARRAWLDLSRALLTLHDKKYDGWDKDAEDAASRLAPKLSTLTLDVTAVGARGETETAAGVEVTLDGEMLAPSLAGTPLERDPGRHVVRVAGERVQGPVEQTVDLAAGDNRRVALRVVVTRETPAQAEVVPGAPFLATHALPADDDGERARRTRRTAGWIALGAGGVALVGAGISLGVRQSALGTLKGQCGASLSGCDPALRSTASTGRTASTLFDVLGVVGLVGAGGGGVLLVTSGHAPPAGLVVTPTVGGASAAWSF